MKKENDLYAIYCSIDSGLQKKWKKSDFISLISNESTIFIYSKPKPLGCLMARILKDEMEIIFLLINKNHRRKGLGRDLLKDLYIIALANKITQIVLEVAITNHAAESLYKSFNFKEVGIRKNYYSRKNKKIDAKVMQLTII